MKIINVATFLLTSTLLERFSNAQIFQATKDVIQHSIGDPFCVYFIRNRGSISIPLEETLIELHIPVILAVSNDKLTANNEEFHLSGSGCQAYIVEAKSNHFLKSTLEESSTFMITPHKRVVVVYTGKEMIDRQLIAYAADIRGIDIITIEGLQDDFHDNIFQNSSVNSQNLHIQFARSNKRLMLPNIITENFKINKQDFEDISWKPKFNSESKSTFKISTFNCPPYILHDSRRRVYDGIEYRIIKELAKGWPIEFTVYTHGTVDPSLYVSARNDIVTKVSDISLCSHFQKGLSGLDTDISIPYDQLCVTFLVRKPKLLPRFLFVFQPLRLELWILIIILTIFCAVLLHIIAKCYKNMENSSHPYLDITLSILETIHLNTTGFSHYFHNVSYQSHLRFILTLLCVQSLLLITAYASGFAGIITYPRFTIPIRTFEDMLTYNISWETSAPESESILRNSLHPTHRRLANLRVVNKSLEQQNERIRYNDNSVMVKALDGGYVTNTESLDEYGRNNLKLLPDCCFTSYIIIPLKKDSPFTKILNVHLSRVFEHGLIKHWHVKMLEQLNETYMYNFHSSYFLRITKPRRLSATDIQGSFCLLGIGYIIAALAFLVEILYEKTKNKVHNLFFRRVMT